MHGAVSSGTGLSQHSQCAHLHQRCRGALGAFSVTLGAGCLVCVTSAIGCSSGAVADEGDMAPGAGESLAAVASPEPDAMPERPAPRAARASDPLLPAPPITTVPPEPVAPVRQPAATADAGSAPAPDGRATASPAVVPPPSLKPNAWVPRRTMDVPRSELSAAELDGRIYLAGGFGNQTRFDAYDVETDAWLSLADLPEQRHHASIAAKDGYVYVFGGNRQTNSWRYDVGADTWEVREPLPLGRHSAVAVNLEGYIYLVGGAGPSAQVLLRLDPTLDTWEQRASLSVGRDHPAAVALGGKIYCIGGRGPGAFYASTEVYDPALDLWSPGPEMGTTRSGAPAVVWNGQIAIFGGEINLAGRSVALDTSEALSVEEGQWQAWPRLPFGVHGVAAAVSGQRLFLLGGSTRPFGIVTVGDVNELTFQ